MEKILENIKEIRTKLSYSQEFMGNKLSKEQASYGLIENGKRKLKYETLEQIAIIFNMNVIDIITYPDVYVKRDEVLADHESIKATLQIELKKEKKDKVLELIFGDSNLEMLK